MVKKKKKEEENTLLAENNEIETAILWYYALSRYIHRDSGEVDVKY